MYMNRFRVLVALFCTIFLFNLVLIPFANARRMLTSAQCLTGEAKE